MPTYVMSCFDLTKTLCDDIGKMIGRYWWANMDNERKTHWVSWETTCSRKEKGGLGFRDLHLFNLAMLVRQGWRLILAPESLCAQVLRAKYYPDGDLLSASEQHEVSYSWCSILRGIGALKQGLIWRIGNGEKVNIWLDPWIPHSANRRPVTPRGHNVFNRVCDLIDPNTGTWDVQLVKEMFWEEDARLILTVQVHVEYDDKLAWHHDTKGIFSVKSAYHVLRDEKNSRARRQVGESSRGRGRST